MGSRLGRLLWNDETDLTVETLCAWEWAAYKQCLDRAAAALDPAWDGRGCHHVLSELDEEVVALACAAFHAGVEAGAAYEHAPNSVPVSEKVCRCNGHGFDWRKAGKPRCRECGGSGVISVLEPLSGFQPPTPN